MNAIFAGDILVTMIPTGREKPMIMFDLAELNQEENLHVDSQIDALRNRLPESKNEDDGKQSS